MVDRYGHARSNYFRDDGLEAFRRTLVPLNVKIVGSNDDDSIGEDGLVALPSEDEKGGWPTSIRWRPSSVPTSLR